MSQDPSECVNRIEDIQVVPPTEMKDQTYETNLVSELHKRAELRGRAQHHMMPARRELFLPTDWGCDPTPQGTRESSESIQIHSRRNDSHP